MSKNVLIADCGSSKIDWALIADGAVKMQVRTPGFNPAVQPQTRLVDILNSPIGQQISLQEVGRIHFYGAGCLPGEISENTLDTLNSIWPFAGVCVGSDLLGAARGLCGHNEGIACILGTGSNSCLFNGTDIVESTPSLGYILGDEGGGSVLGRKLLTAIFKGLLPSHIINAFNETYNLSRNQLIANVYKGEEPNRFMASFVSFLAKNIACREIYQLIYDSFVEFLQHNVARYPGSHDLPINFTGSIAANFTGPLSDALASQNMHLGQILPSPLPALISYHLSSPR